MFESATHKAIIEGQQKAYRDCIQEIDSLVGLKTSPNNANGSQLSNEEYGQRRAKLLKEKAGLEELVSDAGKRIEQQLELSEQTFEFACTAQNRFAKGDAKTKKEMLMTLGSNLILKDKILIITAREPFFILEKSMTDDNSESQAIEPDIVSCWKYGCLEELMEDGTICRKRVTPKACVRIRPHNLRDHLPRCTIRHMPKSLPATRKYFLYCRKSSEAEDRQILSIDSQVIELKRFATKQGIEILEVLTEAKSAKAPGVRPIFNSIYIKTRLKVFFAGSSTAWREIRLMAVQ